MLRSTFYIKIRYTVRWEGVLTALFYVLVYSLFSNFLNRVWLNLVCKTTIERSAIFLKHVQHYAVK